MSNAPSKPVSFSRPKVGYFSNRPRSLQGKDASKPAGNWFQLLMVLFTKEYLLICVLCFLALIFHLRSSLHR